MANLSDFPATGTLKKNGAFIRFQPDGTRYELWLEGPASPAAPGQRVQGVIRAAARKLYTVSSGGTFIDPIAGPPRIVQGRARYLDERTIVIQAGAPIIVELPKDDSAYALAAGPLAVGAMVNVVVAPGASFVPFVPRQP